MWQEFRSVAGGFRMEFPGVPEYHPAKVPTEAAGVIDYHQWGVAFDSDAYFASYGDFPASHIESKGITRMLRDVVDGQVRSWNDGTILSEVVVTIAGHPARDTLVVAKDDRGNFTVRARTILAGSRLYQLFYMTNSGLEPRDAERFLNSFRLIDR